MKKFGVFKEHRVHRYKHTFDFLFPHHALMVICLDLRVSLDGMELSSNATDVSCHSRKPKLI